MNRRTCARALPFPLARFLSIQIVLNSTFDAEMIFPQPRPEPVSAPILLVCRRWYLFHVSERVRSRPGIRAALFGRLQFKESENVSEYICEGI
jgi:hypothetical protein